MPQAKPSLTDTATRGVAWLTGQTFSVKIASLATQIILARLLLREDFGLYGLALTVSHLSRLLERGGIREVLIRRHRSFNQWSNPAVWLALFFGVLGSLSMLVMAPLATRIYNLEQPEELIKIIGVMALAAPIISMGVVPAAKLQVAMRLRVLAMVTVTSMFLDFGLKIAMAFLGAGALSFAWPMVISSIWRTSLFWYLARPRLKRTPQFRYWKYLLSDGLLVMAAQVFSLLIRQGPTIVLGIMASPEIVGVFFLAFNLSVQTVVLFGQNLSHALLPALSHVQENRQRQVIAYTRAVRILALFAVPLCVGQAAIAGPVVKTLFRPEWFGTIPLIQILSFGMMACLASWPAVDLLQAQGRFKTRVMIESVSAILFYGLSFTGVYLGTRVGAPMTGLAYAVSVYYLSTMPLILFPAIGSISGGWQTTWDIFSIPLISSVTSIGAAVLLAEQITNDNQILKAITIIGVSIPIYWFTAQRFTPEVWCDAVGRVSLIVSRKRDSLETTH